jgi:diguanylate cyclase (GGDEF)-like protein
MNLPAELFANCGDGIVLVNHQRQLLLVNSPAEACFPGQSQVLTGTNVTPEVVFWQVDPISGKRHQAHPMDAVLAGESFSDREYLVQSEQAPDRWLSVTGWPVQLAPGQAAGMLILRDTTHRHAIAQQKRQAGLRDKLTGLVNRPVLIDRLQQALIRHQKESQQRIAVLCLDVRRLKAVNDAFGYTAGDQLLLEVTRRCSQVLRPGDTLCRFGGDEFTLLLEDSTSSVEAIELAEAILERLSEPVFLQDHDIHIEAAIGISFSSPECLDPDLLIKRADLAMYRAKQTFGNQYCVFEASMETDTNDSLRLEIALKKGIEKGEMFLHYQPIYLIHNQKIIGFESLVRWQHPTEGLLSPGQFIPLAEKTGLIIPLGWWVLQESCQQLKQWQTEIPETEKLFISVNMSSNQFAQPDVVERVDAILKRTGLSPHCLKIEITEGVLIQNSASIIEILKAIRSLGVKLSVDDFGTGYSSLSYLHQFPVDTLKIDRSFLENADADFEKLEILQSVVRLAWNLGLEVVAEGIETPKHFAQIKALRCESGQGFLFSRPLGTAEAKEMLERQVAQR